MDLPSITGYRRLSVSDENLHSQLDKQKEATFISVDIFVELLH